MARHAILLPDGAAGGENRVIVWDDRAGTVAGDHSAIEEIRQVLGMDMPVTIGDPGRTWTLDDPARRPVDFLTMLAVVENQVYRLPRKALPAVFSDVDIPDGDAGERLFDVDGTELIG